MAERKARGKLPCISSVILHAVMSAVHLDFFSGTSYVLSVFKVGGGDTPPYPPVTWNRTIYRGVVVTFAQIPHASPQRRQKWRRF